ncbi:serine protease [Streptomyces sp. H39-S7]|uniref:serine protease n=1 Tax=Streptomyces sp. H39-S7 TaxID=3004357 RepID=UPI0022B0655B|nr:serine protease [Streptomyces sp. H39-S7]MCZ4119811.1 trypsin-like peptidase domain-containing protein [Streptomyces sp. H39-S7]
MTAALEAHLRSCTVLLRDAQDKALGSGFFVTERLILTAAHVVASARHCASASWNGLDLGILAEEWLWPETVTGARPYPLPDLALLRVVGDTANGHPCVLLGDDRPRGPLLAEGHSLGATGRSKTPDSARLNFETVKPDEGFPLIKCAGGYVDPGLSGGPLLDLLSGQVVGVTKGKRRGDQSLGGLAVSVQTIRDHKPELWSANAAFHQKDRRWAFARLCGDTVTDLNTATRRYFELVRALVVERPVIKPPDRTIGDLEQIPSVRAIRSGARNDHGHDAGASSTVRESGASAVGGAEAAGTENGVFRWVPLTTRWAVVVLTGTPGMGKSHLLSMHTDALAREGLARLNAENNPSASERIPLLTDCSALGNALSGRITDDVAVEALIEALRTEAAIRLTDEPVGPDIEAVVRLAYADGRLVTCLDALDEASTFECGRVLGALKPLVNHGNSLVLTSRPQAAGLRDVMSVLPAGCFRADVVGFSVGQVYAFARAWFADNPVLAARYEAGLKDRPELRALARVPLLAAFLCGLVSEGDDVRALPTSRAMLYQAVVAASLSGSWRFPTSQAMDPCSPPDSRLRLEVLVQALGSLTRSWRSRIDRFPVAELDAALAAHPRFEQAVEGARIRRAMWQVLQPQKDAELPRAALLRWEYMFDGLLSFDGGDGGASTIRFAHPVLSEFCVAAYVAGLDPSDLREVVRRHRWFDSAWEQIWPLAAALMAQPDRLVRLFIDADQDSWREQTLLAGRCLIGVVGRLDPELTRKVVSRTAAAATAPRPFDRDRALNLLGDMVLAGVEGVAATAQKMIDDADLSRRTRLKLVAALAETGDVKGLEEARARVADAEIPTGYRAGLARAIVRANDTEGLAQLRRAIHGSRTLVGRQRLIAAVPVETAAGGALMAEILRDQKMPVLIRSAAGQVLVHLGDIHWIALAKEMAADPLTTWALRASLIAELLGLGENDPPPDTITVLRDPGIPGGTVVTLLENLLRRGEADVVADACALLGQTSVPWLERKRLASALAELGPVGIEALQAHVKSPLPVDLKLRTITALLEVGEAQDMAVGIVNDSGAPSWIRTRLACTLLAPGRRARQTGLDMAAVIGLAREEKPDHSFQGDLIAVLAAHDVPGSGEAALGLLRRARLEQGALYMGSSQFMDALAEGGCAALLARIAEEPNTAAEARVLALARLADIEAEQAGRVARRVLDTFTPFFRFRTVILLAEKGVVEIGEDLTDILGSSLAAHTALYQLLSSPRASSSLVDRLVEFGARFQDIEPEQGYSISINAEMISSCDLTWSSDVELEKIGLEFRRQLEMRVGMKSRAFLGEDEVDEFSTLESEEEGLDFLTSKLGGSSDLVKEQLEALTSEIRDDPRAFLRIVFPGEEPAIRRIAYVSDVICEWLTVPRSSNSLAFAHFLRANEDVLTSRVSSEIIDLARRMTGYYNPYEGLGYLTYLAVSQGIEAATAFITDGAVRQKVMAAHLTDGQGQLLLDTALAGLLLTPNSASTNFYASLGAHLMGLSELAINFMRASGTSALMDQRAAGRVTVLRESVRFGWSAEETDALLTALAGPGGPDARDADPGSTGSPSAESS